MSARRWGRGLLWAIASSVIFLDAQRPQEPPELVALVSKTRTGLDAFWKDQLFNFKPPPRVQAYRPEDPTEPCGSSPAGNAFYCFEDGGIYYDVGYLDGWRTRIGEFAASSTLAHEYGHRVQHHLGLNEAREGLFTLQKELMADCLAGAYLRSLDRKSPLGTAPQRQIALKFTEMGTSDTPWYHPDAHGRPGQRLDAFNEGYGGHSCTSEDFFRTLGIDRDSVQLAPPGRGSLRLRMRQKIDRFDRVGSRWLAGTGAIEALQATYQSASKVELTVLASSYVTTTASAEHLDRAISSLKARGYTEVRRSRIVPAGQSGDGGTLVVFQGAGEVVVWTHGSVFLSVEGPRDHVWEFVSAFL